MAQMDMGLAPTPKKKRRKKQSFWNSIVTGLLPCKGDASAEIMRKIVFLLALVILIVAVIIIIIHFVPYLLLDSNTAVDSNGNLTATDRYVIELKNQEPTQDNIANLPSGTTNERFAALYAENSDFIGWLNIPGTNIDYPVMQNAEKDYYLHRNFQGEYDFSGTLYVDYKGVITPDSMPQNTVIYGHNMLYKFQFSALMNYKKDIDFLKLFPVIEFDTLYNDNQYKIISVLMLNVNEEHGEVFYFNNMNYFRNQDEFFKYILEVEDRSIYETGVDVQYGDELITLATCDESTAFDSRLLVVARKIRPGESPEVDTGKFQRKTSIKYFDAYYDVFGQKWFGRTWDTSVVKGLDDYIERNGLQDDPANY